MKESQLLSAANAAVTQTSVPVDIGDQTSYAIQTAFSSGTSAGTLVLQGSVDNTTFGDIDGTSKVVAAGAAVIYSVANAGYRYVRAYWVPSAGAGTMTVKALVKEPSNKY
jgi:hypothetical protein